MKNLNKSSKRQTRKLLAEILHSLTDQQFETFLSKIKTKTKCKNQNQSVKSQRP